MNPGHTLSFYNFKIYFYFIFHFKCRSIARYFSFMFSYHNLHHLSSTCATCTDNLFTALNLITLIIMLQLVR